MTQQEELMIGGTAEIAVLPPRHGRQRSVRAQRSPRGPTRPAGRRDAQPDGDDQRRGLDGGHDPGVSHHACPIADPMPFDPGNPAYVVAWKYSQWGKVLADMEPFLRLPPVQSMDAFAQQIAKLACSFHL